MWARRSRPAISHRVALAGETRAAVVPAGAAKRRAAKLSAVSLGSIPDWIAAIAAVITTLIASWIGFTTFRQQRTSADITLAFSIFSAINCYWDRLVDDTHSRSYKYNMGQILTQFELAAGLFNNKTLSNKALPILKDHIIEVFSSLEHSTDGEKILDACRSSADTFKELRNFAKRHMPSSSALLLADASKGAD
jgi:hypothetical protein